MLCYQQGVVIQKLGCDWLDFVFKQPCSTFVCLFKFTLAAFGSASSCFRPSCVVLLSLSLASSRQCRTDEEIYLFEFSPIEVVIPKSLGLLKWVGTSSGVSNSFTTSKLERFLHIRLSQYNPLYIKGLNLKKTKSKHLATKVYDRASINNGACFLNLLNDRVFRVMATTKVT